MALKNDFYEEIFINEKKWIEMIDKNLLNNIFCNLELRPFYLKKKDEIKKEYELNNNPILGQILSIIDNIINKLDEFEIQYKNLRYVNIKELLPLFLTSQMNNNSKKEEKKEVIEDLKNEKKLLEEEIINYNRKEKELEDYVYDDFPLDHKKIS